MIKKLLQWLFKKEYQEAKEILDQAKQLNKRVYIKYDQIDLNSAKFIYGIHPFVNSELIIAWFAERKRTFEDMIKYNDTGKRSEYIGSAIAIDILLKDLEVFDSQYNKLLEDQAELNRSAPIE